MNKTVIGAQQKQNSVKLWKEKILDFVIYIALGEPVLSI